MEKVSKKLGDKEQTGLDEFICDIHGKEFVGYGEGYKTCCIKCEEKVKHIEACMRVISEAHSSLCLPKRLKKCTFDSYIPENNEAIKILKKCENFCNSADDKKSGGLILIGGVGTGKTHLAAAICQDFCNQAITSCYTTVSRIVRSIKDSWNKKISKDDWGATVENETEEDIIREHATCGLLVIDEIGSQYGSDTERIVISEIINDRYNRMLPTIIIGNVTFSEVQEAIGKRAVDRICDNGQVLIFNWESHRKQAIA